jgi:hypothetical protein
MCRAFYPFWGCSAPFPPGMLSCFGLLVGIPACGVSVGILWYVGVWVCALYRVSIHLAFATLTGLSVVVQKCKIMVKSTALLIQYIL